MTFTTGVETTVVTKVGGRRRSPSEQPTYRTIDMGIRLRDVSLVTKPS